MMQKKNIIVGIFITLILTIPLIIAPIATVFAQVLPADSSDPSIQAQRAALEAELAALQKEIAEKEAILKQQQQQTGTIKKDVTLLTTQIATAKLKIQQKTISINNLSKEIKAKTGAIVDLESEISREHDSLAQLVKRTHELDQKGATYVLLSAQSVTDFYQDLDDFLAVKQSLYASVNHIKQIKDFTEDQKESLEDKQEQEKDAKNAIDAQKKVVEKSEAEKRKLLAASQGKEKEYQVVLAERQKKLQKSEQNSFSLQEDQKRFHSVMHIHMPVPHLQKQVFGLHLFLQS